VFRDVSGKAAHHGKTQQKTSFLILISVKYNVFLRVVVGGDGKVLPWHFAEIFRVAVVIFQ
jgi:hypothetical protein